MEAVGQSRDGLLCWHNPARVSHGCICRHQPLVLANLVSNAIKFSHPGSTVTIAARPDTDGSLRISVRDEGLGMPAEQTARLFQPFARVGVEATAGEKSTGLGLAIVRRIVEAHQGRVEVESAPGEGTTFTVLLPTAPAISRVVG